MPYAIAAAVGSLMMRCTLMPEMVPASLVACRCASLKYAGTVTTAWLIVLPRNVSATVRILERIIAEISSGANVFFSSLTMTWTYGLSSLLMISYGSSFLSACTDLSMYLRPMSRLTSKTVFSGLMVAWFLAASPMRRSPELSHATYDGVMRLPCGCLMVTHPARQRG